MRSFHLALGCAAFASTALADFVEPPPTTADPNTIQDCTLWHIAVSADTCSSVSSTYGLTEQQFTTYNPSLADACDFIVGNSYCVEQNWGIPPETPTPTTSTAAPTSTGNGIETPTPTQEGMTKDCNKFHLVVDGDGCTSIQSTYGVTFAQLFEWNPAIGNNCQSIWLKTYLCVGVIGGSVTTTPPATTTTPGNGISTPTPTQDGMVDNCNKFHLVSEGDGCTSIGTQYGVTVAQLFAWNPAIGNNCQSMWLNTYLCVGIIGGSETTTPPATTTTPGNGISTPTPIQDGMVDNCNKFHLVVNGDGCTSIGTQYGVTVAQLFAWNPAIGNNCQSMWLNTYLCVGVIGGTPTTTTTTTTTTPGNGVTTPTPIREGMTPNCVGFHFVVENETCATISARYNISFAQFLAWNPSVGSGCAGLWLNTYFCVGSTDTLPTTTTTTTTSTGNGVATPTPTQPGMVTNCKTFYKVVSGDDCTKIAAARGITVANFIRWNTGVGSNCQYLWLDTYYCVGLI